MATGKNITINYVEIIDRISKEIKQTADEIVRLGQTEDKFYQETLKKFEKTVFYVSDEQSYNKLTQKDPNTIYIVVKFGGASTNFGSSICPIHLRVLAQENKIIPAQMFFAAFVAQWNIQPLVSLEGNEVDKSSVQIWNTPEISSNFNQVGTGFRSLFSVGGTLVLGNDTLKTLTMLYVYDEDAFNLDTETNPQLRTQGCEVIPVLSKQSSFQNSLNPQPFGNTYGFSKSETNFSTDTFAISTYLLDCQLVRDYLSMKGFRKRNENGEYVSGQKIKNPNDSFTIYFFFSNGYTNYVPQSEQSDADDPVKGNNFFFKWKIHSINDGEKIGDIPTITISFTH